LTYINYDQAVSIGPNLDVHRSRKTLLACRDIFGEGAASRVAGGKEEVTGDRCIRHLSVQTELRAVIMHGVIKLGRQGPTSGNTFEYPVTHYRLVLILHLQVPIATEGNLQPR
jgi:hypothetical protein